MVEIKLPMKVVLSFSFFDFGCAGVYKLQNNSTTFELLDSSKARRIVFQRDNVLGPSWVLLDPTHNIHYCLVVSNPAEFPLEGWQPVGIPKRFLPTLKWFDSDELSLIERLRRLPACGVIRKEAHAAVLDLDPSWVDFLDNLDYDFAPENLSIATEKANVWADLMQLSKRRIEQFSPNNCSIQIHLEEDSSIQDGDEINFHCECINEEIMNKLQSFDPEMDAEQDFASLVLFVTLNLDTPDLPSVELPLSCFGIREIPQGKGRQLLLQSKGFSIHTQTDSMESYNSDAMGSPMTVTSSDEERDFNDFALAPSEDDPDLDGETGAIDFDDLSDEDSCGSGGLGDAFADELGAPDFDDDDDFLQPPPDENEKKNILRWSTDIDEIVDQKTEGEQTYFKVAWKNEEEGEFETWETEEDARKYAGLLVDQFTGIPSSSQASCAALDFDMLAELGEVEVSDEEEEGEFGDENLKLSEEEEFEITYEETAPIRAANGDTVHEIKRKLRQIERVKKSMMRGKKVSTEQVRLMDKKKELEQMLEQAKIDSQFDTLRQAARQQNNQGLDTLTAAERNNLRAFANTHNNGGSAPAPSRTRRRARRPMGGLETINELGSVSE